MLNLAINLMVDEATAIRWAAVPKGHEFVSARIEVDIKDGELLPSMLSIRTHGLRKDGTLSNGVTVTHLEVEPEWWSELVLELNMAVRLICDVQGVTR